MSFDLATRLHFPHDLDVSVEFDLEHRIVWFCGEPRALLDYLLGRRRQVSALLVDSQRALDAEAVYERAGA